MVLFGCLEIAFEQEVLAPHPRAALRAATTKILIREQYIIEGMGKKTLSFRIYGTYENKIWKLIWASQGSNKDIQYSAHITGGKSYTSVHQSGETHTTIHTPEGPKYETKKQRRWTLDTFKFIDFLNCGGFSKEALTSIPLTKKQTRNEESYNLDIDEYNRELNYWFFLVEKKLIKEVLTQMKEMFPKAKFIFAESFNPILLVMAFNPNEGDYGKKLIIKAKNNSIQMIIPKEIKLHFPQFKK